jgi:hypothetical protein
VSGSPAKKNETGQTLDYHIKNNKIVGVQSRNKCSSQYREDAAVCSSPDRECGWSWVIMAGLLQRSNIPRTALVATLDTYDFKNLIF